MTVHDEIFGEWEARVASKSQAVKPSKRRTEVPEPRKGNPVSNGGVPFARYGCIALIVAVGLYRGLDWYRGDASQPSIVAPRPAALAPRAKPIPARAKPIRDIQLGERVAGVNPLREDADFEEPDPSTWKAVRLEMTKPSGRLLQIELLRPIAWFEENQATVGATIEVELEEMGAVGPATITEIGPCPAIAPGNGAIVTGKFVHEADEQSSLMRLKLAGQSETIGVTANHLYWSEDRTAFVPAGELRGGVAVNISGGTAYVASVEPDPGVKGYLYNLETTEHVYRVGSLGTLVHNKCVVTPYTDDGGHHVFAKRAFEGLSDYDPDAALAIGKSEIARLKLRHLDAGGITQTQRRLFTELAESGRPNTLAEHARIARESLIAGGLSKSDAQIVVDKALKQLQSWGIKAPVHIPWN
jgi:hypothetical protein